MRPDMFESTADEICGFRKAENALKAYRPLKITDNKSHLFKILVNLFLFVYFEFFIERSKKKVSFNGRFSNDRYSKHQKWKLF